MNRYLRLALLPYFVTGLFWTPTGPFVGDWKFNPSKSTLTDEIEVKSVGRVGMNGIVSGLLSKFL